VRDCGAVLDNLKQYESSLAGVLSVTRMKTAPEAALMRSIASQLSRSLERSRGEESPLPHGLQDHNPGTRGFSRGSQEHRDPAPAFQQVFRTIPALRGVWNGATGVAREESEAVQNFLRGIWRMNRGKNPHAPSATGTLQHIQASDALHQSAQV
jgi:hypothetical protein